MPELRARLSRTTVFRLTLGYVALLLLAVLALIALIYCQAAHYTEQQADEILYSEWRQLSHRDADQLPDEIRRQEASDQREVISFGLFDARGQHRYGRIGTLPLDVAVDGGPQRWQAEGLQRGAKAIVQRLPDGQLLMVGYDAKTLGNLRGILIASVGWAAALILLAGVAGVVLLGSGPLHRVRDVQRISRRIAAGDFTQRLPLTGKGDELDVLSSLINQMIDEVGLLLDEVKSVGDNVAHDLRTPLNKLRAQLHRALADWELAPADQLKARLEKSLDAADVLLERFRALQRVAEIDSRARRAFMVRLAPGPLLEQLFEDYEAVAEEAGIRLQLRIEEVMPLLADRELLAEALMNLLENAFKFTPEGGHVLLAVRRSAQGTRIEVQDNGPGIASHERETVLSRFARGQREPGVSGAGLGLAIVAAVARTHGYQLLLEDAQPGLRVVLLASPPVKA